MSTISDNRYEPFKVYLADVSYFSGKLEALLRYKKIKFERIQVNASSLVNEVYPHTGLMKVPVVRMANGQWLQDTTPMFDWLEQTFPDHPIMPSDPVQYFLSKLVEDYADEGCWRSAMYWRWRFPETRQLLSQRISAEVLADWPVPKALGGWYFAQRQIRTFLTGDGLTPKTEAHIKNHYFHLLDAMTLLLKDQPFLLGAQPSLVDFALFGPMFRHFSLDPAPAKVMRDEAPIVYEWVARMWNAKGGESFKKGYDAGSKQAKVTSGFNHKGWEFFLKDCVQSYWPMLIQNAQSWQRGESRMDFSTKEVAFSGLKVVHYRVYCLEVLQNLYQVLSVEDQEKVNTILAPYGALNFIDGLDSGLLREYQLPLKGEAKQVSILQKLALMVTGTPWDKPLRR